MSRVGGGPHPTEDPEWAARYGIEERGTTTGRPRRIGKPHFGLLKEVARLTKPDCWYVSNVDRLRGAVVHVALWHEYGDGSRSNFDPSGEGVVYGVEPFRWKFPDAKKEHLRDGGFSAFPPELRHFLLAIARYTGVPVGYVGIGPERGMVVTKSVYEATMSAIG